MNEPSAKAQAPDPRRALPAIDLLLQEPRLEALCATFARAEVLEAARQTLADLRSELQPTDPPLATGQVVARIEEQLMRHERERLRPVINATGVILHTGLGRAVLPTAAARALAGLDRCCNLQIDLATGRRGKRNYMSERLLCRLTGAEAAMIVNNNAAATLLVLAALCAPREVIVSRGQLIEIGGSFRLPDCIHQSGATLVEVGTTNKTHLRDYEAALGERSAAILRVNPSNYRIIGFSKEVPIEELVGLKRKQPVLVIDDLGCGALIDLTALGLPREPTVPESIAAGADLALFSADKLIGGPQAGLIVGKKDLIEKIKKHPLTRMLRVDKLTDLALEQTLRLFLEPGTLARDNPTLRMLTTPAEALKKRGARLLKRIETKTPGLRVRLAAGESAVGGGSLPGAPLATWTLAVSAEGFGADEISLRLRQSEPPVIARIERDEVILDLRTIFEDEEEALGQALARLGARSETK